MIRHRARWGVLVSSLVLCAAACGDGGRSSATASAEAKASQAPTASAKLATSAATTASATASTTASAVTSASAAPAADADGVAVKKHYAVVGDKETSDRTQTTKFAGTVKGPKGEQKVDNQEVEVTQKDEECTEVKDQSCTKLKVTIRKATSHMVESGKVKDVVKATQGNVYFVAFGDTGPTVTREDGKPLSREESSEFKDKYKKSSRAKEFLDAFPDKVKVGDSLDAVAKKLGEQAADSEDKPKAVSTVKVKAIEDRGGKKIIILDVRVTLEGDSSKVGHMKLDMSGTLEVRADAAVPVALDFSGPASVQFPKDAGRLEGTMTEKTTLTQSF